MTASVFYISATRYTSATMIRRFVTIIHKNLKNLVHTEYSSHKFTRGTLDISAL